MHLFVKRKCNKDVGYTHIIEQQKQKNFAGSVKYSEEEWIKAYLMGNSSGRYRIDNWQFIER